jgi:hypothetical protein
LFATLSVLGGQGVHTSWFRRALFLVLLLLLLPPLLPLLPPLLAPLPPLPFPPPPLLLPLPLLPLPSSRARRLPAAATIGWAAAGPALLFESNGSAQYPRCPVSFQRAPHVMLVLEGLVAMQQPLENCPQSAVLRSQVPGTDADLYSMLCASEAAAALKS